MVSITIGDLRRLLPQVTIQSIKAGPVESWDNGFGYMETHVPTIIEAKSAAGLSGVYRVEHPPEIVRAMLAG